MESSKERGKKKPHFQKSAAPKTIEVEDITYSQAIWIGIAQIFALIPGTSRAGSTIVGALIVGLSRKASAEFSFLLALPVLSAASGLDLLKHYEEFAGENLLPLIVGFVVSFIVLFAYVYSQRPYVNNWQGELGAAEPFVKAPLEVGASPQAHDDVENHNFLSARFLSKIQKLNRQKALGYFSDVKSELQVLKEASQYRNEQEYLETYGKGLEIQRSKDFLRLKGVVANLSTVSKYDQARRLLVNSIKNYGVCKEQKLLEDLLAEIPLKEK